MADWIILKSQFNNKHLSTKVWQDTGVLFRPPLLHFCPVGHLRCQLTEITQFVASYLCCGYKSTQPHNGVNFLQNLCIKTRTIEPCTSSLVMSAILPYIRQSHESSRQLKNPTRFCSKYSPFSMRKNSLCCIFLEKFTQFSGSDSRYSYHFLAELSLYYFPFFWWVSLLQIQIKICKINQI